MATQLLGVDTSHFQGRPNLAAFKKAGGSFVIAKATEGNYFVDAEHDISRADALAAGLVFGSYHFTRLTNVAAEAAWFLQHAKPRPGELVALDVEVTVPGVDMVAWADAFSRIIKAALGCPSIVYMNQSYLNGHNWAPVIADNDSLWLAKYDGSTAQPASGAWPLASFKQFTDKGVEPGFSGGVDVDEFYGDLAALMKYTVPAPQGDPLSALSDAQQLALAQQVNDMHFWLAGVKNAENPDGKDNVFLIWAMGRQMLVLLAALQANLVAANTELDTVRAQLAALQQAPPGTAEIATAVVAAVDADLSTRFGNQKP